jgi:hypothetical protein
LLLDSCDDACQLEAAAAGAELLESLELDDVDDFSELDDESLELEDFSELDDFSALDDDDSEDLELLAASRLSLR